MGVVLVAHFLKRSSIDFKITRSLKEWHERCWFESTRAIQVTTAIETLGREGRGLALERLGDVRDVIRKGTKREPNQCVVLVKN